MNQKRFVGFTLILVGMLISLSRIAFTGAVVGVEKSCLAGICGGALVFVGFLALIAARLEK